MRGDVYNSGGTLSPGSGSSTLGASSGNIEANAAADALENESLGQDVNPMNEVKLNGDTDLRNLNFTLVSAARLSDAQSGASPLAGPAAPYAAEVNRDLPVGRSRSDLAIAGNSPIGVPHPGQVAVGFGNHRQEA